ncbi:ATP-binding protein [Aliiroseovarius subalbicans]|uniref:ATP-binding protein n=1 Tax=Aliiroseovarius subalbicans TaxID=2925840 RepID=UPI001F59DB5E|nr:ATP-binding protein [Aliiroseovarius subalbicans]MCI2400199.1 ATP-binding protein [Aliiroseovarius subalbicans]
MGHARDLHKGSILPTCPRLHLVFPSDELAVRKALKSSMAGLAHMDMSADEKGTVELVLAEVLNNVVEHAYGGAGQGVIELDVSRDDDILVFDVLDDGLPMPDGETPAGRPLDLDTCAEQDLPEGGFGWFLIRELTQDLTYRRDGNRNHLSFKMRLGDKYRPN